MTIADLLKLALRLASVSESPRLDAEVLLGYVLGKPRSYLYTWPEKQLEPDISQKFENLLQRRQTGTPIAHLIGKKEFWSLELEVNASTLIPRPDTELLVETALQLIDKPRIRVLDLGTGTGAIALALASERPDWQILAVDVMPEAVLLAEKNCRRLGFNNVTVRASDWFVNLVGMTFDLILANPYIAMHDMHLAQGDVRFEPASALVSARRGLADIDTIIASAGAYLGQQGWLLLEHGYKQAGQVRELLSRADFVGINTRSDLSGHERLTYGHWRV